MTFTQDAQVFLAQDLFPRLQHFLADSPYVNRLLFRENADVMEARSLHRFLKDQGRDTENDVIEDQRLEKQPYMLLLGNAGSGKSFVLAFACIQAIQRFLHSPVLPFPLFLDLDKELPTTLGVQSIEDTLNFRHAGLFQPVCTEASGRCALFLDGLDEVLRRAPAFINDLQMFLRKHWEHLAQVVVTCRRAAWSPDWFATTPIQLKVYHADDLGWQEYAQILPEPTHQRAFFQQCRELGIETLLGTPFDGFYLAREFRAGRPLPQSRRACLSQRIAEALRGRAVDRKDGNAPSVDDLRFLAQQLACVGSFTHHTAWTLQEATDLLGTSQVLRVGRPIRPEEVHTLFTRPLFKKSNERFAFIHQLYQEFLTAEALAIMPLRKQRQLVATKHPGQRRMQTAHRGIAIFLAEASDAFATYLVDADPLVAFLAEMPSLSQEMDQRLLQSVLDDAVASGRAPWWDIPPRGERPDAALGKHCPQDMVAFLQPYLTSPSEIARIWGTACAKAWGGAKALHSVLNQLAHDASQHIEIRKAAIAAIAATQDREDVQSLYDLFEESHDEVRGEVLQAYRQVEAPAPRDFIARLCGGSRTPHLYCLLQVEAEHYGSLLGPSQLGEAFAALAEHFEVLGNLKSFLLRGLVLQAMALRFTEVDADLIVQCWARRIDDDVYDESVRKEEGLKQLLRELPALFEHVWHRTLALLARDDNENISETEFAEHLAACCTDRLLALLPPSAAGLTRRQQWLIEDVLTRYFYTEPTIARHARLQRLVPAFTQHLRVPMPPQQPPSRDPYADAQKLSEALTAGGHHPLTQTWHVLCAIAEMEYGSPHRDVTTEDVLRVLRRVTASVKQRILASFRACIAEIHYERRETTASNISLTSLKLEIPFWVLRQQGESCAVEKVAEIICCYYGIYGDPDRYEELLEELRQRDRVLWERCILQVLESGGIVSLHRPIQYLIRVHEPIYLPQCRERLEQGAFDRSHVDSLLAYLSALRPPWYREALQQYYTRVKKLVHQRIGGGRQESLKPGQGNGAEGARALSYWDQFCPLLLLMSDDDDWAWREFAHRLRREDVPLQHEEFPGMRHMHFPDSSARLPVLADWYALMRRKRSAEDMNPFDLARSLLERIVTIDGESAIQELRRLQRTHAFPDARWLSHAMFRIEDRLLTAESMPWESGLLLDFINKEHLGVIRHEHDLFEWVCQAIEDVQESLERRGEGVAGFWKGHMPHHEASCQNILWAFLRLTIQRSAIAAVEGEEKCIGRNRCDFWVEYPRRGADAFRVGVELKVARAGYGAAELVQPVETQLWDKYLRPTGCRHGIFVVLWFRDNRRYHGPVHWDTRNALAEMLRKRCKELEQQHGVSLTSYVIDLTRPFRER